MRTIVLPSVETLFNLFEVDELSPSFLIWRERPYHFNQTREKGDIVGSLHPSGYYSVPFSGKNFLVHRIVFQMFNPEVDITGFMVDHIDENPVNNHPENLRLATATQNNINRSNVKGVSFVKKAKKWQARIGFEGKRIYLGSFKTKEEAIISYQEGKNKYYGEFSPFI